MPDQPDTQSARLPDYDYSEPGAYFITVCSYQRRGLFGRVVDGEMILNTAGEIVKREWTRTVKIRTNVELDKYVIMPNHIHGIVILFPDVYRPDGQSHSDWRATGRSPLPAAGPRPDSLGAIIAGFKAAATSGIRRMTGQPDLRIWQRNYYEHIIRNERDLDAIRAYILRNPMNWGSDHYHPDRSPPT